MVCLLPPGAPCLGKQAQTVPQAHLLDPVKAKALFDGAYPQRFRGDAFMWECDGTVIVTDSHENQDTPQTFTLPLGPGLVLELSGSLGVHQYLVGKIAKDGQSFWFQANGEYPERDIAFAITCARKPELRIEPEASGREVRWEEATKKLHLRLALRQGAVEGRVYKAELSTN